MELKQFQTAFRALRPCCVRRGLEFKLAKVLLLVARQLQQKILVGGQGSSSRSGRSSTMILFLQLLVVATQLLEKVLE